MGLGRERVSTHCGPSLCPKAGKAEVELGCLSLYIHQGLSVSTMVWYRAEMMWTPRVFRHDQWRTHTQGLH